MPRKSRKMPRYFRQIGFVGGECSIRQDECAYHSPFHNVDGVDKVGSLGILAPLVVQAWVLLTALYSNTFSLK